MIVPITMLLVSCQQLIFRSKNRRDGIEGPPPEASPTFHSISRLFSPAPTVASLHPTFFDQMVWALKWVAQHELHPVRKNFMGPRSGEKCWVTFLKSASNFASIGISCETFWKTSIFSIFNMCWTFGGSGGGSNELQNRWNFFLPLFMRFLHRKKSLRLKIKKSVFLRHPSAQHPIKSIVKPSREPNPTNT